MGRAKLMYKGSPKKGISILAECLTVPYCISITIKLHFGPVDNSERISNFCDDYLHEIKTCGIWEKYISDYDIPTTEKLSNRTRQMKIDITGVFKTRPKTYKEAKAIYAPLNDNLVKWCENLCLKHGLVLQNVIKNPPKQIAQYTLDGELIRIWDNASQASEETGISSGNMLTCARGKTSHAGGFKWKVLA